MFRKCFACWTLLEEVKKWFVTHFWRELAKLAERCRRRRCNWWCLCCNKWFCWLVWIITRVLVAIVQLIVNILVIVICTLASLVCLLCAIVCYIGCLGRKACIEHCLRNCPSREHPQHPPPPPDTTTPPTGPVPPPFPTGSTTTSDTNSEFSTITALRIASIDELEAAVQWRWLFTSSTPIRLELTHVSNEESNHLQSKVDQYLAACGCQEGKIGVALAILLWVIDLLMRPAVLFLLSWTDVGLGLGFIFFGALIGKLAGVLRARILLRKSVKEFKRLLQGSVDISP